jgi:hypothetical protein
MLRAAVVLVAILPLLVARPLVAATSSLGSERPMSDVRRGPAFGRAGRQAIAATPNGFDIVWATSQSLKLTRTTPLGAILDPLGIDLAPVKAYAPAIAGDATSELVVWDGDDGIRASILNGTELAQPGGVQLAAQGRRPSVAFNGSSFLVTWEAADFSLGGALLDRNGNVEKVLRLSDDGFYPQVTSNGSDFCVVYGADYYTSDSVRSVRISGSGQISAESTFSGSGRSAPDVTADGLSYVLVWSDGTLLRMTRSTQGGGSGEPVTVAETASGALQPKVVSTDGGFFVTWVEDQPTGGIPEMTDAGEIRFEILNRDFSVVVGPAVVGSSHDLAWGNWWPAPAVRDGQVLLSWLLDPTRYGYNLAPRLARINLAGDVTQLGTYAIGADSQRWVKSARIGTITLAAWIESSPDQTDSRAAFGRYDAFGQPLDGAGVIVGHAGRETIAAAVATDGTDFLIGWLETVPKYAEADFYLVRVSQAGVRIGSEQRFRGLRGHLDIGWNGSSFMAVAGAAVYPISREGALLGEPLGLATYRFVALDMASNGSAVEIVYEQFDENGSAIKLLRVDGSGASGPIVLASGAVNPRIASDGHGFVVVYSDGLERAVFIREDGSVGRNLSAGAVGNIEGLTWDGASYVAAFSPSNQSPVHSIIVRRFDQSHWGDPARVEFESALGDLELVQGALGTEVQYSRVTEGIEGAETYRLFSRRLMVDALEALAPRRRVVAR